MNLRLSPQSEHYINFYLYILLLITKDRASYTLEQISVERKFVEKYMARYSQQQIHRIQVYIEERRTSQRTSRMIPAMSRWYTGSPYCPVSLASLDTASS